ncbi:MAG: DHA2 family efflux MFS transporter permease subunit [Acidimicrobiales bacterium]|nr:DHA2 family efflux MFS transporter permease subunit [Acidimicrobiales bacterium]
MPHAQPDVAAPVTTVRREAWVALFVSTMVTFLVVIDISAVNVAFPSIREDLEVSEAQLSWVISGYNITVGALLLMAGRLADSWGRRKVYLPGVAGFMVGSLLCGLAPSVELLIAARVVQAIGGAIVAAAGFAVVLPDFPPAKRSTAIGFAGAAGGLGAVTGPALGSILIDAFNWRAIFFLNVPICLLVLVLGPRLLRESSDPDATGRIDYIGVVIGTLAVGLLMFSIVQSEAWGISDARVIGLFIVGALLFPALVARSRRHPEPLIDLSLFQFQSFRSTNVGVTLYGFAFTAGFLVNSLVLQDLWGQSIRVTGAALVLPPVVAAIISPISGSVADRIGHRWVLGLGSTLCGIGYLAYALILDEAPHVFDRFVPIGLIAGAGVGLTVATWSSAGISDIPPPKFGVAGATLNTTRQAAYALGISVCITLIASGASKLDFAGYQRAWFWVAGCYFLSALAIVIMFPAGSSHDRGTVD